MTCLRLLLCAALSLTVAGADWPQFRGPNLAGTVDEPDVPVRWDGENNLRWRAALPGRGVSSPVVVDGRVYLTACSGMNQTRLHLLCFEVETGAKLWERQFWATGSTNCHPKTCVAAPTPVVGRGCVFAMFASGDVVCTDAGGSVRWLRCLQVDEPEMTNLVGRAASPILDGNVLVVPMESQGKSFLFGLDAADGRNRWQAERPSENSYTTPLLVRHAGIKDLVVQAQGSLTGYDPATGAKRWSLDDAGVSAIASPLAAEGLLLATGREMLALRPREAGPPEVVWRSARLGCGTPTPLAFGGRVYAVKDGGILTCGELQTGKQLWTERLRGSYSASPVVATDRLYLVNEDGETTVVRVGGEPQRVATNRLDGPVLATPAVAGGCIFLRSDRWLSCVAAARPGR